MASGVIFNRATQVAIDGCVLAAAYWLAFALRFDFDLPWPMLERAAVVFPYVVALQYAALHLFAVPRFSWRFVGLREAQRILAAILSATAALALLRAVSGATLDVFSYARYGVIPFGVLLINALLAVGGIVGVRMLRRVVAERSQTRQLRRPRLQARRTLLIGAGQAGFLVARELQGRPDLGFQAVGFLDDDPQKRGSLVHGVPVLGGLADLRALVAEHRVEQALITIANAPGQAIRQIARACEAAGLPPKIIPGIYEIVGGQVNLSRIRAVSIDDLLRREEVALDVDAIGSIVRGRVVVVTGAGGSIGSELCRQLCQFEPSRLVCVDQAENPLFAIHGELRDRFRALTIDPRVADVTDEVRLEALFEDLRPAAVFHAAAHKHVPMMEANPGEAIKNNVVGTRTVADVAHQTGVGVFVMISTDKAVNPTSIMGASKRVAELYVQALAKRSATRFVTVRFGNVLGSNGSVVPTFQAQIARGGPVTVTHPEMTRFFMTIPEACRLVIQAATMGKGGETFILDMGEPVRIVDLARDLITLSGFVPDVDVKIEYSGLRPGEKLHEELSHADEHADRTGHAKIFIGRGEPRPWEELTAAIERLRAMADAPSDVVRDEFKALLPEYTRGGPSSDAYRKPLAAQAR